MGEIRLRMQRTCIPSCLHLVMARPLHQTFSLLPGFEYSTFVKTHHPWLHCVLLRTCFQLPDDGNELLYRRLVQWLLGQILLGFVDVALIRCSYLCCCRARLPRAFALSPWGEKSLEKPIRELQMDAYVCILLRWSVLSPESGNPRAYVWSEHAMGIDCQGDRELELFQGSSKDCEVF